MAATRHVSVSLDGKEIQMPVSVSAIFRLIDSGVDPVLITRELTVRKIKAQRESRELELEECSLGLSTRQMIAAIHVGVAEAGKSFSLEDVARMMIDQGVYSFDGPVTEYILAFNTGGEERHFTPVKEDEENRPLSGAA